MVTENQSSSGYSHNEKTLSGKITVKMTFTLDTALKFTGTYESTRDFDDEGEDDVLVNYNIVGTKDTAETDSSDTDTSTN